MRLKRAINEFSILPGSSFSVYLEEILPPRVIAACTVMGAPARMIVFREDRSLTIFESERAYGQSTNRLFDGERCAPSYGGETSAPTNPPPDILGFSEVLVRSPAPGWEIGKSSSWPRVCSKSRVRPSGRALLKKFSSWHWKKGRSTIVESSNGDGELLTTDLHHIRFIKRARHGSPLAPLLRRG